MRGVPEKGTRMWMWKNCAHDGHCIEPRRHSNPAITMAPCALMLAFLLSSCCPGGAEAFASVHPAASTPITSSGSRVPVGAGVCARVSGSTALSAKKKDRKESMGKAYFGRAPKAEGPGLELAHEKKGPATGPATAQPAKNKKKKKLTTSQQAVHDNAMAALAQFESANSQAARAGEEDAEKKMGASAMGHAAARRVRMQAEKAARKAEREQAQARFLQEKENSDRAERQGRGWAGAKNDRSNLFSRISPKYQRAQMDGALGGLHGRAENDDVDEGAVQEGAHGQEEMVLMEDRQRKQAKWYAGYFKPRI